MVWSTFVSGFYKLYKSLEHVEKVRILVGLSTDKNTYNLILAGALLSIALNPFLFRLIESKMLKEKTLPAE